jgi:hypothetical protein
LVAESKTWGGALSLPKSIFAGNAGLFFIKSCYKTSMKFSVQGAMAV